MTYKHSISSIIMIMAAGLTVWTMYLSYRPQQHVVSHEPKLPDAFMENVSALILDKQGKPRLKIVAPQMVHYFLEDTTEIAEPELTLYRKSPKPWYITAKHAKASQGIDNIDFWENVAIHHAADENNPSTMIKTASLLVHPNQNTAETNKLITLIQPNLVVNALGMQADMNTGDIKLLSQTRGEYVPNS
jgi:lipopolysaccharide export system protein LptC